MKILFQIPVNKRIPAIMAESDKPFVGRILCAMKLLIDYTQFYGLKFGLLTVYKDVEIRAKGRKRMWVKCDCGVEKTVDWQSLKAGNVKSCGCNMYPKTKDRSHPLYSIWQAIKQRCLNPNCDNYKYYGARGVSICEEWENDFLAFRDWCLANGWKAGLHLDKDIKGGIIYSPDTCIFISPQKNYRNKRDVRLNEQMAAEIRDSKESTINVAKRFGISREHARQIRVGKKWKPIV